MDDQRNNIFLIGFMGVGKSSVAKMLSEKTGALQVEMDQVIVEQQDMAISDIFDEYGEKYFRRLEYDLLLELQKKDHQIISCGGGVVLREENVDIMKSCGCIVLLEAEPETIYGRVKGNHDRPLLNGNMSISYIKELMMERQERYEEAADIRVATDHKSIEMIVEEILRKLKKIDDSYNK